MASKNPPPLELASLDLKCLGVNPEVAKIVCVGPHAQISGVRCLEIGVNTRIISTRGR